MNEWVRWNQTLRPCRIDNEERQRPARRLRPTIQLTTLFTPSRPRNLTNKGKKKEPPKEPASRAPKTTPARQNPVVRLRRTRSDESRRRSVRHTSVCTPTRAERAPGHEPRVEKVTRSTCPTPGKASYAPVREYPTQPNDERTPYGINDHGRRAHQQAADPGGQRTPLCAHHWLVRLARAWSLLSCAPAEGRQDAHWENWYARLHEHGDPEGDIDSMSTHRPTQRAQPFRRITENDALIRWLGGLQGWRTAVRDVEGDSALKESYDQRRDGLLRNN